MNEPQGIDYLRGVARMHVKPVFASRILALNANVTVATLESFIAGKSELASEALDKLIDVLFHGKARWDAESGGLVGVVKPPTPVGVAPPPYASSP